MTRLATSCRALLLCALAFVVTGAQTKPVEEWREKFDAVYAPKEGEVLKRLMPPFIPERDDFYASHFPRMDQAPSAIIILWFGSSPNVRGMFSRSGEGWPLWVILREVLGLQGHEFDGPSLLLNRHFDGDWVVPISGVEKGFPPIYKRPDAKAMLDALARMISEDLGKPHVFVRETINREVIVAAGRPNPPGDRFQATPLELPLTGILFRSVFGGQGRIDHLLDQIPATTGWPVIMDIEQMPPFASFDWGTAESDKSVDENADEVPREQMEALIGAIAEQTGIQLRIEEREITRWTLKGKQ
jgi:hypothetical protein